ncbi:hypothetical protein BDN67DRAFT_983520 [Paxillus ammoniavirescens]|nr:hypothetical protein BDN67DRAFT_983520 [Paxillus ammoniavirescens]
MPFPLLQVSSSSTQYYQLDGRLSGEANGAINCVTINNQGTFLASGAMWITPKGKARETLCFGTGLGYLIFWRQSASLLAQFEEVIVKRVGTGCVRIVTATRERHMMVWTFNNNVLMPTLSIQLNVTVPKGIAFVTGQDDFTRPMVCKPKKVAFGEKGSIIIGGSESGVGGHCHEMRCCILAVKYYQNCGPPIQSLTTAVSKIFGGTSSSNETSGVAAVPELMCLTTEEKKRYLKLQEENQRREQERMERMKTLDGDKADLVIYV